MKLSEFKQKVNRRVWGRIVRYSRNKAFYPYLYRSFWHSKFFDNRKQTSTPCYLAARPNYGAGIGHQIGNWIAGYWIAQQFGMKFAHLPFPNQSWENFLGLGDGETTVCELRKQKYKIRKLPLFSEENEKEVEQTKNIIRSYSGKKMVFICEQDQTYKAQFGVMSDFKRKFYGTKARKNDKLIYSNDYFNIAVHIRRGDIVIGQINRDPSLLMRWQDNDYFKNVLTNVLKRIETDKPVAIYLFSEGKESDFQDFADFPELHFCLDMNAQDSFLHLIYADLLITSKSSFSYQPALLNNGIKVCPKDFWHSYPATKDWILADENGNI